MTAAKLVEDLNTKELHEKYLLLISRWIAAIHQEAALSSKIASVEDIDAWEAAFFSQSEIGE